MSNSFEELDELLFDWEAGSLDDAGIERVREMLRADDGARRHFARHQVLSAALQMEGDSGLRDGCTRLPADEVVVPAERSMAVKAKVALQPVSWVAIAAGLLACVLGARLAYVESTNVSVVETLLPIEQTSSGVALLTRLVDVSWAKRQSLVEIGDALPPGRFAIAEGLAQVEFFCGATVILEGPAELELASPTLARVLSGRLRAQVPPAARGFSLEVDDMKIVDLGTEFGINVTPDGANVQVFDGEVELHRPDLEVHSLSAGQAIARSPGGPLKDAQVTPDDFVSIEHLESQANGVQAERFNRWRQWSQRQRNDSRLIAYYTFDRRDSWKRKLQNMTLPENREFDGAIVGATRAEGRWAEKSSLEFKRPGDRVRLQIPGEFSSLTFVCWAKIDSLDRKFNSLFLTDGYDQGEPHWQILDTGQLYFSVRPSKDKPRDFKAISESFWRPSMSGKWLHFAVTYDPGKRSIVHYLNGEVFSRHEVPYLQAIKTTRIGTASIGNWSAPTQPDSVFAIRNLNGSIDEFAAFSEALTLDEVRELYGKGKP